MQKFYGSVFFSRLRVVSSFPLGDRRERAKSGARINKSERGEAEKDCLDKCNNFLTQFIVDFLVFLGLGAGLTLMKTTNAVAAKLNLAGSYSSENQFA